MGKQCDVQKDVRLLFSSWIETRLCEKMLSILIFFSALNVQEQPCKIVLRPLHEYLIDNSALANAFDYCGL